MWTTKAAIGLDNKVDNADLEAEKAEKGRKGAEMTAMGKPGLWAVSEEKRAEKSLSAFFRLLRR